MTLRIHDLSRMWAALSVVLAGVLAYGCGGGTPNGGGEDGRYSLEVVAEKDLGNNVDYLHVRFIKDGIAVVNGYVKIDGDSLSLTASGYAFKTYPSSHFPHSGQIDIEAGDPDNNFVYMDSVIMPIALGVDVVPEADTIWQPIKGTVSISWSLSNPVSGYIVSVTPEMSGSPAPGLATEATTGSFSFSPPEVFYDQLTDTLVSDLYNVRVIGYNRTYVQRQQSSYVLLPTSDFPLTTDTNDMAARISATVVSPKAVIVAEQLNP